MTVHGSHCCKLHGCKYGNDDCTVYHGTEPQQYRQECCDLDDEILVDAYARVCRDMQTKNLLHISLTDIRRAIKSKDQHGNHHDLY